KRGGGIRSYAALDRVRRRRLGYELVEAGERLGLVVGSEVFVACHQAVRTEDGEHQVGRFEGAAGLAVGSRTLPTHQEGLGSQTEDVLGAVRHVGYRLKDHTED